MTHLSIVCYGLEALKTAQNKVEIFWQKIPGQQAWNKLIKKELELILGELGFRYYGKVDTAKHVSQFVVKIAK